MTFISKKNLVFFGVGQVACAVADVAHEHETSNNGDWEWDFFGTTRSAARDDELRGYGMLPRVITSFRDYGPLREDSYVVVSFPPDPEADEAACEIAKTAKAIVYISSTAVYGKKEGIIDEQTEVDTESPISQTRLDSERKWLQVGASIVRAPGIYGNGRGVHERLKGGNYRLPGDGSNYVSRIHVDDLAEVVYRVLWLEKRGQIYLAADNQPTTHIEIVEWLRERLHFPRPEPLRLEYCHYTQRFNRQINATKSLNELGVQLKYPTYKEGYAHELKLNE